MLKNRCNPLNLDDFEGLDKKRRDLLQESEALKSQRNTVSKEISVMKKNKEDAEAKILEMRAVGAKISELDKELKDVEAQLRDIMLHIPNMPREDVPIGKDDTENPEVRKWGEPTKFDFEPKAHWDLGTELDILDADRAAKVTGARFTFYKGLPPRARLHQLHDGSARQQARLHGDARTVHRQQGEHDGYGPAAEVCR